MLGNKPIYGLDSHLKPTCQAAAHPLSTLQSLGNISNQPALQPQERQHEPSHQWTCCSPQKRIVCVPPCIKCRRWTLQKRHLKPIRWCSGTNQSTASPETNLPGCRTSPVDLAKPWEHLKPNCFAAARTSNMSLHTSGHVVAPKSGLFACHHASNADGEPRKNDTLNQ